MRTKSLGKISSTDITEIERDGNMNMRMYSSHAHRHNSHRFEDDVQKKTRDFDCGVFRYLLYDRFTTLHDL